MIFPYKKIFSFFIALLSVIGYGAVVFSAQLTGGTPPPTGGYAAGDSILDPGCAPGAANCYQNAGVYIGQSVGGGTQDHILYTSTTGGVVGDSYFTRNSVTKETLITAGSGTLLNGFSTNTAGSSIRYSDTGTGLDSTTTNTALLARIRYRDLTNGLLGRLQLEATGNSLLWDADTTDDIQDGFIQGNNLSGVGIKGNALAHSNTSTFESASLFAGDTTAVGGNPYEVSMSYVLPGGINGAFAYIVNDDGLKAEYYDIVGNIKSQILQKVTGNTISWDADTTDTIITTIEQNQDLFGLGSFSGTGLTWEDSSTNIQAIVAVADATSGGGQPGNAILSTLDTATGYQAAFITANDPIDGMNAGAFAQNGNIGTNLSLSSIDGILNYRTQGGVGQEAMVSVTPTETFMSFVADSLSSTYKVYLGDGRFNFSNTSLGTDYLKLNSVSGLYGFGDLSGGLNSTKVVVDDAARAFQVTMGTEKVIDLTFAGRLGIGLLAGMNTSGADNVSVGLSAGTGANGAVYQRSVSVGAYAGQNQDAFGANTLVGWSAGNQLTGGNSVMIGYEAGVLTSTPWSNVMIGYQSGHLNTGGSNNMFLGALSGANNTSGSYNIAIGDTAGAVNQTGSSNIYIGSNSAASATGLSASIAMGREAQISASNQMVIGSTNYPINEIYMVSNGGTSCAQDINGLTCSSDERLKKNITDLPSSTLDNLMRLRTVTFNWNEGQDTENHIGFIAQNLQQVYPELVSTAPNGFLQANYAGMTPLLVQAVRELNMKITAVENGTSPTLFSRLTEWLASASNGIQNIVTRKLTTDMICVTDANGETCLNRAQVDQLLQTQTVQPIPPAQQTPLVLDSAPEIIENPLEVIEQPVITDVIVE